MGICDGKIRNGGGEMYSCWIVDLRRLDVGRDSKSNMSSSVVVAN